MPTTYQIELPDGKMLEVESEKELNQQDISRLAAQQMGIKPEPQGQRFNVNLPGLADFDPDGGSPAIPRYILRGEDKKKFSSAKIGDELEFGGEKFTKASDDELDLTGSSKIQNPLEAAAISAGINSPAALAGLAASGAVMSRVKGKTGLIAGLTAGVGASMAEGFLQRKVTPDVINELERKTAEESPYAYTVGRMLGSGMKPGGFSGSLAQEARERVIPAGIGAGVQAGFDASTGRLGTLESTRDIALAGIENLILKDTNALGNKALGAFAKAPKVDITSQLGNVKAGDPLPKSTASANEIVAGQPEDLTGLPMLEPAPVIDLPLETPSQQRISLAQERRAAPLESIKLEEQVAREVMDASQTTLAKRELGDKAQVAINEAFGVTKTPNKAEDTLLAQSLLEGDKTVKVSSELDAVKTEVEAAKLTAFNKRVADTMVNLANEGVELDRQTAAKLALIKNPQEFNVARQQLIDSVKAETPDIPKAGEMKMKSLEELEPGFFPPGEDFPQATPQKIAADSKITSSPKSEAGMANPAVMLNVAAPAAGAIYGSTQGDTNEERIKNAALFAGAASGTTAGMTALVAAARKNPQLLQAFRDSMDAAKKAREESPSMYQQMVGDQADPKIAEINAPTEKGVATIENNVKFNPVFGRVVGDFVSNILPVVDNIRNVHPEAAGLVRDMAQYEINTLSAAYDKTMPSLQQLRKLVGNDQFDKIGQLLRDGHEAEVLRIIEGIDGGKPIAEGIRNGWMKVRDELHQAALESRPGEEIPKLENYWPSRVSNMEKVREILDVEEPSRISDALAAAKKNRGRELTEDEEAAVISDLMSRSTQAPGKPGNLKQRTIQKIGDELKMVYEPMDVAIDRYLAEGVRDFAIRKFLGKIDPNSTSPWIAAGQEDAGTIGQLTKDLISRKEIDGRGLNVIQDNINAYIARPRSSTFGAKTANVVGAIQTVGNLGQMANVLGQLSDVFTTAVNRDAGSSFKNFAESIAGVKKGKLKLEDINLHEGNPETMGYSREYGTLNKAVDVVLTPFFKWSDRVGKEAFLNATKEWTGSQMKSDNPSFKFQQMQRQQKEMFGDEYWQKVRQAFAKEDWASPDLKKFLFNEISNVQPTTRADMPLGRLKSSGLGRIAWGLTSFQLRQMGRAKSMIVDEWRKGNKESAALWGAQYLFWMAVGNSTIQFMRDIYAGKEDVSLGDYAFGSILQALGMNKATVAESTKGDIPKIVGDRMVPGIAPIGRAVVHDLGMARDIVKGQGPENIATESDLIKYTPWVGDLFYKNVGRGKTLRDEANRKQGGDKTDLQKIEDAILGSGSPQR